QPRQLPQAVNQSLQPRTSRTPWAWLPDSTRTPRPWTACSGSALVFVESWQRDALCRSPGNPKPRVFRLSADSAIINRLRIQQLRHEQALVNLALSLAVGFGVNLGANKSSSDPDYLVINVSSPNTPGVRDLQRASEIAKPFWPVCWLPQMKAVKLDGWKGKAGSRYHGNPASAVSQISPDCSDQELADICAVAESVGADGLKFISNTTVSRPSSLSASSDLTGQAGGLSGQPLALSLRRLTGGRMPIIGVGGFVQRSRRTGEAGVRSLPAAAVTALVYEGPPVVNRINRELEALLKAKGYRSVADAVGAKHRAEKCSVGNSNPNTASTMQKKADLQQQKHITGGGPVTER
uniref:DHO_dh domain-containing protein n=1 Tax=Macrostomum lignano TaxID=282301 RepID=A0A1I8FA61_9PLAT